MARGFESKSVADQQEAARMAADRQAPAETGIPPAVANKRRSLELTRVDLANRLAAARTDAHRLMLKNALAALDKELAKG